MDVSERLRQRSRLRGRMDVVLGALHAACPVSALRELAHVDPELLTDDESKLVESLETRAADLPPGDVSAAREVARLATYVCESLRRDALYQQLLRAVEARQYGQVERLLRALTQPSLTMRERRLLESLRRELILAESGHASAELRSRSLARRLLEGGASDS